MSEDMLINFRGCKCFSVYQGMMKQHPKLNLYVNLAASKGYALIIFPELQGGQEEFMVSGINTLDHEA